MGDIGVLMDFLFYFMLFVAMRLLCLCFCLGFLFQVVEWGMGGFWGIFMLYLEMGLLFLCS